MSGDKKKELRKFKRMCRHKAEIPMFVLSIVLTMGILSSITYFGVIKIGSQENFVKLMEEFEINENAAELLIGFGRFLSIGLIAILVFRLFFTFFRDYGRAIARDLPITENQFEELYTKAREYSERLGIEEEPKIYSSAEDEYVDFHGIEMFSPFVIKVDADTFAATYELENMDNMLYDIAFDLAADFMGHKNIWRFVVTCAVNWIPIYGDLCYRIMCYTDDRVVRELMGDEAALKSLTTKLNYCWMIPYTSEDEYVKDINRPLTPFQSVARFVENLLSKEPIPAYRIATMADPTKKNGRLF